MGSLININIPTRKHEITLRINANHVILQEGAEKDVASVASDEPALDAPPGSSDMELRKMLDQLEDKIKVPADDDDVTLRGTSKGRKVDVVITHDTFEIWPRDPARKAAILQGRDNDPRLAESEYINSIFFEKATEDVIDKYSLNNSSWTESIDGRFSIVIFTETQDRADKIVSELQTYGIGTKYQSKLSIVEAVVHIDAMAKPKDEVKKDEKLDEKKESWGQKFKASIRARLTVAQVIQTVSQGSTINFDFLILILIAGMIAAFGLLSNSSVSLVASMLISPLMGPILAQTFGIMVRDHRLAMKGLLAESVGLNICLLLGFIFGILLSIHERGPWDNMNWPTEEMVGRGKLRSILIGALVAGPSGAGVALSILGGNAGGLVGVAISASLLPPAVNSGLFAALSLTVYFREISAGRSVGGCNDYLGGYDNNSIAEKYYTKGYAEPVYCNNLIIDYARLGLCSFGLTLVNIVIIILMGVIILKIKEVAPYTARKGLKRFWKEDIKVMRDYNKKHGGFREEELIRDIKQHPKFNPEEFKEEMGKDHTFETVKRRMVFQDSDILQKFNEPDNEGDSPGQNQGNETASRTESSVTNRSINP